MTRTNFVILMALFTKFLTPGLTCEINNPLDDWLESISSTNHPTGYIIRRITRELKNLVNKVLSAV